MSGIGVVGRIHALPANTYPLAQTKPQLPPSHVATELSGGEQGAHELPHEPMLALLAHAPLHT